MVKGEFFFFEINVLVIFFYAINAKFTGRIRSVSSSKTLKGLFHPAFLARVIGVSSLGWPLLPPFSWAMKMATNNTPNNDPAETLAHQG